MTFKVKNIFLEAVVLSLLVSTSVQSRVSESQDTAYLGGILDERLARKELSGNASDLRRQGLIALQEAAFEKLASSVILDRTFSVGLQDSVAEVADDLRPRGQKFLSSLKALMENARHTYPELSAIFNKLSSDLEGKSISDEKTPVSGTLSSDQLGIETSQVQRRLDQYVENIKTLDEVVKLLGALPKVQGWINDVGTKIIRDSWFDSAAETDLKTRIRATLFAGEGLYGFNSSDKLLSKDVLSARLEYAFKLLKKKLESKCDDEMSLKLRKKIQKNIEDLKTFYSAKIQLSNQLTDAKKLKNWIKTSNSLEKTLVPIDVWFLYNSIEAVSSFNFDFFKDVRNIEMMRAILLSRVDELIDLTEKALKQVQTEKEENTQKPIQDEDALIETNLKSSISSRLYGYNPMGTTQARIESFKKIQKWINGKKANLLFLSTDAYRVYKDICGFFGDVSYIGVYEGVSWSVLEKRVKKGLALEEEYLKNMGSKSKSGGKTSGASSSSYSDADYYKTEWYKMSLKEQRAKIEAQKTAMENSPYQMKNFRKTNGYAKFIYKLLLTDLKQDGITDENAFERCEALKIGGIKKEYRKWALKLHPDKNPGDAAKEEEFKSLSSAYDNLNLLLEAEPF